MVAVFVTDGGYIGRLSSSRPIMFVEIFRKSFGLLISELEEVDSAFFSGDAEAASSGSTSLR